MLFSLKRKALLFTLMPCLSLPVTAQALNVQTSITPIQLIASEVLDGVSNPGVILPPGASPHEFSLKPSQVRALRTADLVVWVGPSLELSMEKTINQASGVKLQLLTDEEGGGFKHGDKDHQEEAHQDHHDDAKDHHEEAHHARNDHHGDEHKGHHKDEHDDHKGHHEDEHEEHDEGGHGHHHHHGDEDPHIWLDPALAGEIAEKIAHQAAEIEPAKAKIIQANLARFKSEMDELEHELEHQLEPVKNRGFISFHDAYKRFIGHYGLNEVAVFSVDPTKKPGAKHLTKLRSKMMSSEATCILVEPQFSDSVIDSITSGIDVKTGIVDPLGQNIEPGKGAYLRFLREFSTNLIGCLKP